MLSADALARIERELVKYPAEQKTIRSAGPLAVPRIEHGWLSRELMEEVAAVLQMPAIAVYEVASFYNDVQHGAVGRFKLDDLHHLPCALVGANDAARYLQTSLASGSMRRPRTAAFTLKEGECLAHVATHRCWLVNKSAVQPDEQ